MVCSLVSCNTVNKEDLKKEILSEIESSRTTVVVKKGDGNNFYAEPIFLGSNGTYINEIDIQHSTINCPAIRNGVQRNCYKTNAYNNTFCNLCMTDALITIWNKRFFPNGYRND